MFDEFPIQFDHPGWLLLLLLIVPAILIARKSIGGLSKRKAYVSLIIRSMVILLLSLTLAQPVWEERGEGLTVTVLLDRSQSVPLPLQKYALDFIREAAALKENPEDRLSVITLARDATIVALPDKYSAVPDPIQDPPDLAATNLAAGVRTAIATMPDDTANRIVIVSDGNETIDNVRAAAELAKANDVRIDVLVLEYEHENEVLFDRIVAPARARQGQAADLKLVLRSKGTATGTITLDMNGLPLDLNGDAQGVGMGVALKPGVNAIRIPIAFDESGPMRFVAHFEPDDDSVDSVAANNVAMAVTFVGGEGKVLIIDDGNESEYLAKALTDSKITVHIGSPDVLGNGAVYLSGYDAIVLVNIPRFAVNDDEDPMLHAYVHDMGGGLVMIGGPESFGAGGWIDSQVAKVLPVKLDPPQTRQMVRGALGLIMHSCEMPQGNYWGQRVAEAAIEALSSQDYAGIIDWGFNGVGWEYGPEIVGDKSRALAATKKMLVGDMPDFASSMTLALKDLDPLPAGQKHVIIISDGDPQPPPKKLLNNYVAASISVTTVLVAGHGSPADRKMMKAIAAITGGNFYEVKNPKNLPQIFIKEAQIVSRSLIVEGDFQPTVVNSLPGPVAGFGAVPSIDGYILVAEREGLTQMPIVNATDEGMDPIYAYWNYGLGKSIAYTPDLTGRWGSDWVGWSEFKSFWEQSIRWVMRPSSPTNMTINTRKEGDIAIIELEALDANASYLNFLRTSAVVLSPDGVAEPLVLQQVGPGRYLGQFPTEEAGAYLVNINFVGGSGEDRLEGNIQAAVTVPYPREYRAVKHNAALLHDLAKMTGGRVINGSDPMLADLFYNEGLELPLSPKSTWDLMAILAAALFLFDVANRRISIDKKAMAEAAAKAVGRRAEVGSDTVAAWKRTRASVVKGRAKAEHAVVATKRFDADDVDAQTAIDVQAESAGQPGSPARKSVQQTSVAKEDPVSDEGDYTSRLLAAKRRARGEDNKEPQGGSDA